MVTLLFFSFDKRQRAGCNCKEFEFGQLFIMNDYLFLRVIIIIVYIIIINMNLVLSVYFNTQAQYILANNITILNADSKKNKRT